MLEKLLFALFVFSILLSLNYALLATVNIVKYLRISKTEKYYRAMLYGYNPEGVFVRTIGRQISFCIISIVAAWILY